MSREAHHGHFYDPVESLDNHSSASTFQTTAKTSIVHQASAITKTHRFTPPAYGNPVCGGRQYMNSHASDANANASASLTDIGSSGDGASSYSGSRTEQDDNINRWKANTTAVNYSNTFNDHQQRQQQPRRHNSPAFLNAQPANRTNDAENAWRNHDSSNNRHSQMSHDSNYVPSASTTASAQRTHPRGNSPLHAMQTSQPNQHVSDSYDSIRNTFPRLPTPTTSYENFIGQQVKSSNTMPAMTVNPSVVYDNRTELQRQARIEAEKRKQREAEQLAQRAEVERAAAADRACVQVEGQRALEAERDARRKAVEMAKRQEQQQQALTQREQQERNWERNSGVHEGKGQSKTAATALQQLAASALSSPQVDNALTGVDDDDETEMRELFKKMREFNNKNPAMLAKLWEEERSNHVQGQSASTQPEIMVQKPRPSSSVVDGSAFMKNTRTEVPQLANTAPVAPDQKTTRRRGVGRSSAAAAYKPPPPWTDEKKEQTAEAIISWLKSHEENRNKSITKALLMRIFQGQPSFLRLCEALDQIGLRFDRLALAKVLIKALPRGSKLPSPAVHDNISQPADVSSEPHQAEVPIATGASGATYQAVQSFPQSRAGFVHYETPQGLGPVMSIPVNPNAAQMHGVVSHMNGNSSGVSSAYSNAAQQSSGAPTHVNPKPAQSNPNFGKAPPARPPANKEEAARKRAFGDLVDLTAGDLDDEDERARKRVMLQQAANTQAEVRPPYDPRLDSHWDPLGQNHFLSRSPKLGVVGVDFRHPQTLSPNLQTTEALQSVPTAPQQPLNMPRKPKELTQEQLQLSRMRAKMLVEPIMRDRVARKSQYDSRTIARDVLLATGRHPDMRGLNAHLAPMQKLLSDHGGQHDSEGRSNLKCDLATIRWDIIDPEQPAASSGPPLPTTAAADDRGSSGNSALKNSTDIYGNNKDHETRRSFESKPPKRRGRPRQVSLTNGLGGSTSRQATPNKKQPVSAASPPTNPTGAMSGAVGYAAFRQVDATGAKKKGRPFGWRKSIHGRAAHGQSPGLQSQTPTGALQVEPKYQEYPCAWFKCNAVLHNMDALKRHTLKLHDKPSSMNEFECHWRNCNDEKFRDRQSWMQHVESRHLQPLAWKLGDGPRGGALSELVGDSDYLNDARGRSVTPVISPLSPGDIAGPGDLDSNPNTIQWPTRRGRAHTDRINHTSIAELQELEKHKLAVGPVLDRQGCILASEERRLTFLEDEDFEDEVMGSEHDCTEIHHDVTDMKRG